MGNKLTSHNMSVAPKWCACQLYLLCTQPTQFCSTTGPTLAPHDAYARQCCKMCTQMAHHCHSGCWPTYQAGCACVIVPHATAYACRTPTSPLQCQLLMEIRARALLATDLLALVALGATYVCHHTFNDATCNSWCTNLMAIKSATMPQLTIREFECLHALRTKARVLRLPPPNNPRHRVVYMHRNNRTPHTA